MVNALGSLEEKLNLLEQAINANFDVTEVIAHCDEYKSVRKKVSAKLAEPYDRKYAQLVEKWDNVLQELDL